MNAQSDHISNVFVTGGDCRWREEQIRAGRVGDRDERALSCCGLSEARHTVEVTYLMYGKVHASDDLASSTSWSLPPMAFSCSY